MKHGLNTDFEENVAVARWRTTQYQERFEQTRNILCSALNQKHTIDWEKLIEEYPVVTPKPEVPIYYECCPPKPQLVSPELTNYIEFPPEPQRTDEKYQTPGDATVQEYACVRDYEIWATEVKRIEAENQKLYDENVLAIEQCNSEHEQEIAKWHKTNERKEIENSKRKEKYEAALEQWNVGCIQQESEVAKLKTHYGELNPSAVKYYCKLVLSFSKFPDGSHREFDFDYIPETRILIVDHALPAPDDLVASKKSDISSPRMSLLRLSFRTANLIKFMMILFTKFACEHSTNSLMLTKAMR